LLESIGVIGFGKIAQAIITPLLEQNKIDQKRVFCVVKSDDSIERIKREYPFKINIYSVEDPNYKFAWNSSINILAVKPQQLNEVADQMSLLDFNESKHKGLLISILAGVGLNRLEKIFYRHRCVRVVTNIPIVVGQGLTAITWGGDIIENDQHLTRQVFEKSSQIFEYKEEFLDPFLALTSSGPAIISLILDSLSDGGLASGIPLQNSQYLVLETVLGTISLMQEKNISFSEVKELVTSPSGTTIAALRVLEDGKIRSTLIEAIVEATKRSREFY